MFGKAGRAESSTDPAPFSMMETTVVLKPESAWRDGIPIAGLSQSQPRQRGRKAVGGGSREGPLRSGERQHLHLPPQACAVSVRRAGGRPAPRQQRAAPAARPTLAASEAQHTYRAETPQRSAEPTRAEPLGGVLDDRGPHCRRAFQHRPPLHRDPVQRGHDDEPRARRQRRRQRVEIGRQGPRIHVVQRDPDSGTDRGRRNVEAGERGERRDHVAAEVARRFDEGDLQGLRAAGEEAHVLRCKLAHQQLVQRGPRIPSGHERGASRAERGPRQRGVDRGLSHGRRFASRGPNRFVTNIGSRFHRATATRYTGRSGDGVARIPCGDHCAHGSGTSTPPHCRLK